MKEKLLTSGQVAEICQVSVPTVLNWIHSDFLPSYKTAGGHNRISPFGLLRFLSNRKMYIPDELYGISGVEPGTFSETNAVEKPIAVVADDDRTVRMLMRDVLESVNYIVIEAEDGLQACLQVGLQRPQLLILDILMPQMDGVQVVQAIRQQAELARTRIIVITGALDTEISKKLHDLGVNQILEKPISITEFVRLAGIRNIT